MGRATISVREDEIAAESVGVNPTFVKVSAFVFGAMTAPLQVVSMQDTLGQLFRKTLPL